MSLSKDLEILDPHFYCAGDCFDESCNEEYAERIKPVKTEIELHIIIGFTSRLSIVIRPTWRWGKTYNSRGFGFISIGRPGCH